MSQDRSETEEPPPPPATQARLELKAGLLLAMFAVLVGAAVTYLLYARGAFEDTQTLVLLTDDTEGVTVGMDLTFSGFPIGRVRRIELADDATGRIVIDVPRKDAKRLRTTSVFTLTRGLLGNTSLKAYTGIPEDPLLPDRAERRVLVGDATSEIPRLVTDSRDLIRGLALFSATDGPLAASLANLQTFTAKLAGAEGALGALLGSGAEAKKIGTTLDRTNALLARVDALTAKADDRVFGQAGMAAKVDAQVFGKDGVLQETRAAIVQLQGLLTDARDRLKNIDALLADAQIIATNTRDASTDLTALRNEVEANLRKISGMIDEVNRRWPFARDTEIKLP